MWIDAAQDSEVIKEEIQAMLDESPADNPGDYAIHDVDDFGSISISEHADLDIVSEIATFIAEHGELGAELLNYLCLDFEEAQRLMDECYQGEYDNAIEFAQQLAEELWGIPDNIAYYIDYEMFANDLFISDYFSIEADGKIHVFINN